MRVGATGPIMKAISSRRSHRRQWHIFEAVTMVLLDAILIGASFGLAYFMRYYVLFKSHLMVFFLDNIEASLAHSAVSFTPFSNFLGLGMTVVMGLISIFEIRGWYHS